MNVIDRCPNGIAYGLAALTLLIILTGLAPGTTGSLSAAVWYVNDTAIAGDVYTQALGADTAAGDTAAPFRTITKALTVAASGDTIYIDAGTYWSADSIVIETNGIALLGKDSAATVIDFNDTTAGGYRAVYATGVSRLTLRDFTVRRGWSGIKMFAVDTVTIERVTSELNGHAGIAIGGNGIGSNQLGIRNCVSRNNVLSGYSLSDLGGSTIENNLSDANGIGSSSGFAFDGVIGSHNNTITGNVATNGMEGFYLGNANNNLLSGNLAQGNSDDGFGISGSNNALTNNRSFGNAAQGFWFDSAIGGLVANNLARNNLTEGLQFDSTTNLTCFQNQADSNGEWGMVIAGTSANLALQKNVILVSPARPDSGVLNATTSTFLFLRSWWGTGDSLSIRGMIGGIGADSIIFAPYRLGLLDTASGADTIAPQSPASLYMDTSTVGQITVAWDTSSTNEEIGGVLTDLAGFRVYRAAAADSYGTYLGTTAANDTDYVDATVTGGQTYFYRVTAYDNHTPVNEGWYSSAVSGVAAAYNGPLWYVDDTGSNNNSGSVTSPFLTIRRALQAVYASGTDTGETIHIGTGTFTEETVVVDSSYVALIGVDSVQTIIYQSDTVYDYIIHADTQTGLLIKNLRVVNSGYNSIDWENITNSRVENVDVDTGGSGISLDSCSNIVLTGNSVSHHAFTGIYLSNCRNSSITGNSAVDNEYGYGIFLDYGSNNNMITNNTIFNNGMSAISINGSDYNVVTGNYCVLSYWYVGIDLSNANYNVFIDNIIYDNLYGISLVSNTPGGNYFSRNTIDSNGLQGIFISNSSGDTFTKNIITMSPYISNDSAVINDTSSGISFTRNWWGTTDSQVIRNRIYGLRADSVVYQPYRLGIIDTAPGADTIAPQSPASVTVDSNGGGWLTLRWDSTTTNEENGGALTDLAGFKIYRSTGTNSYGTVIGSAAPNDTDFIDSTITYGVTYYYRVTAFDNHSPNTNEGWFSAVASSVADTKAGDLTGDNVVDTADLHLMLPLVGQPASANPFADLDNNGRINVTDLSILIGKYGQ